MSSIRSGKATKVPCSKDRATGAGRRRDCCWHQDRKGRGAPQGPTHPTQTGNGEFHSERPGATISDDPSTPLLWVLRDTLGMTGSVLFMAGVLSAVPVPRGAVVVADSWWQAKQAADALDITFAPTPQGSVSTAAIDAMMTEALGRTDVQMTTLRGDAGAALSSDGMVVEAEYHAPMLAHVCMEPMNCTAESTNDRTGLWFGTQGHDMARMILERVLQVPAERVFINTQPLGSGFGRKTSNEIVLQAVLASSAMRGPPVEVLWARKDDVQQGLSANNEMPHAGRSGRIRQHQGHTCPHCRAAPLAWVSMPWRSEPGT